MLPVDSTASTATSASEKQPTSPPRRTFSRPTPITLPARALTITPENNDFPFSPSPFHPSHIPRTLRQRRPSVHPLAAALSFSTENTSENIESSSEPEEKEKCEGGKPHSLSECESRTPTEPIPCATTDNPSLLGQYGSSPPTHTISRGSITSENATFAKPPFFALTPQPPVSVNNTWSSPMSTSVSPNGSRNASPIRKSFSFSDTDNMDCFGLTLAEERDRFSKFPYPAPRSTARRSQSPSTSSTAHLRSVTRRSSLLPKTKSVNRILSLLDDESHPFDMEVARERETNHVITLETQSTMDTSETTTGDANAQQAWTKYLEYQPAVYYSQSKLNPELEIIRLRDQTPSPTMSISVSSPASPAWQGPARGKRKASDDRFEPYCALKRRAVSPGMVSSTTSLPTTPIGVGVGATGIHGPAAAAGTGGSGGNAAARASQAQAMAVAATKKNLINMQGTSGCFSKMSLN